MVFLLGDDCFIARDMIQVMLNHENSGHVCISTFVTMFNEKEMKAVPRIHTGLIKTEYLKKYPFNETLDKGIDREYFQEMVKRGDSYYVINYYFGLYDRRHDDHRSAPVVLSKPDRNKYICNIKRWNKFYKSISK